MAVEFDTKVMEDAMRAALIIAQQQEILDENATALAGDFGVSKAIAKKIVAAFAQDTLEKTQEKMEEQRSALANADVMLEAVENMSFDPEDLVDTPAED